MKSRHHPAHNAATALLMLAFSALPGHAQRPAPAASTVPLTDLLTLAKPYPNLISVIRLQLLASGKKKEAIACKSSGIPGTWPSLGGRPVAPYVCPIGKRTLTVTAEPTYYDANSYKLKSSDPALATKATRFSESKLKWTWK
jgi:hypothetical protein